MRLVSLFSQPNASPFLGIFEKFPPDVPKSTDLVRLDHETPFSHHKVPDGTKKESEMKFAILVYEESSEAAHREGPGSEEYWGAYNLYAASLGQAGVIAGGNVLQGSSMATTVRLEGQTPVIQDGPFAVTKEQLGGLFILDVPTLDDALEWAKKCPAVTRGRGSVEVRPVLERGA